MRRNFLQECDYEHGYQQALLDVKNWFSNHTESLKYHKVYNQKKIEQLLSCFCNNADSLMKMGEDLELRVTDKGFEVEK